jgi:hypothetical protein
MRRQDQSIIQPWPSMPAWRRRLHDRAYISRLEKAVPHLNDEYVERIDAAISVAIHWKDPDEAERDRLCEIGKVARELATLLRDHIEKDRQNGAPPKHCLPGCDDAQSLMEGLERITSAGPVARKSQKRGHPKDDVTDFFLLTLSKIYRDAGGIGTPGSKSFAYFLDELANAMPKCLLGSRRKDAAGKWLARRAKDLPFPSNKDKIIVPTVE